MKPINIIFSIILICLSYISWGQAYLSPAPPQSEAILVTGATAHLGNGDVIENSVLAFENGKITAIGGPEVMARLDKSNYQEINAIGKHIYPGFIAANTQLGLREIGAVRATRDNSETGSINPNVRALIAYNTDSRVTPTVRSNGVLLAQTTPTGGRVSGTSSVVQLDAWNWEDAAYSADNGLHLNWPSVYNYSWRKRSYEPNKNYAKDVKELENYFKQAQAYSQKDDPATANLRFEAMQGLFDGSQTLFINARNVKSIMEAVRFGEQFGIRTVIVGARDAWMITDFLKEHNALILLQQTHSLPARSGEDIDQPYKTPAILQEAGITFGLYMGGFWEVRNLPFIAGHAVPYGLEYEDAVASISSNVAKILGIDDTVGTLEADKDATFIISEGDALDMRTSKIVMAFINGRKIDLDNKQKMLYRKYKEKYDNQ